ncbi:MAG: ABC transporter permease [Alphaproteobacteria bacterium]|nr:ABC transporter permease [Alphaproteobacteria bacterium]
MLDRLAGRLGPAALLLPAVALLAVVFVLPLLRLLELSFSDPAGAATPYVELLHDPIYRKVFAATAWVAVAVTAITVLLGYPFALALARAPLRWRVILFACVLTPLWISVLVRTFSWMLLLETNGPVNRLLVAGGIVERPLALLFNQTGVLIGMVHVLLPYAVLPIYAALVRVDPALLRASEGLGASPARTFLRVLLPLSMPGVATGGAFVFLLSLGFFITPALLGGASSITLSMLIDGFVNERLVWPLAAAASMILLAATLAFLAMAARFVAPAAVAEVR